MNQPSTANPRDLNIKALVKEFRRIPVKDWERTEVEIAGLYSSSGDIEKVEILKSHQHKDRRKVTTIYPAKVVLVSDICSG